MDWDVRIRPKYMLYHYMYNTGNRFYKILHLSSKLIYTLFIINILF